MEVVPIGYISKKEREKIEEWMRTRPDIYAGAIGGAFTYHITPTGLGPVVKVSFMKGTKHEEIFDATDYEDW